ncbi:hypothetical protein JCGZ_22106 [Jatropha curcas]|uniref:Uncharacterized protein n=1 Tax=Jatropha curcas TaxID=180498 RepID=A0A067JQV2_JATCU|nr:hypothetical protein JCGZ_22106 [Jatropha curcas]
MDGVRESEKRTDDGVREDEERVDDKVKDEDVGLERVGANDEAWCLGHNRGRGLDTEATEGEDELRDDKYDVEAGDDDFITIMKDKEKAVECKVRPKSSFTQSVLLVIKGLLL